MEDKMMQRNTNIIWAAALAIVMVAGMAVAADFERAEEKHFLTKVSGSQEAEIAFGRMAADRAESAKVKQFGQRMIEDHQKAAMEVKQLAVKQGIDLPAPMVPEEKEQAEKFAQLAGKEFDRAYIGYMVKEHMKDVAEFEHTGKQLKDPNVKQWVTATLPVLKEHLTIAKNIADDMGISSK
jgi:putative membrane protein